MDPRLYSDVFLALAMTLSFIYSARYLSSDGYCLKEEKENFLYPLLLSIFLVAWLGFRPLHFVFGDSYFYAHTYNTFFNTIEVDISKEWAWDGLMYVCKSLGFSASSFFGVVSIGYIISALVAVKIMMPNNSMLAMIFILSSLMFYGFCVNGIRNGMACHIVLLGLALLLNNKHTIGALLLFLALGSHKSTMLPIAAIVAAFMFKDKVKYAIYIWLLSIPFSLVAGGAATIFFASLGFDDRMSSYSDANADMSVFSSSGFRWDFLLYSSFPVLMAWFVCIKRQISDNWYNVICIIYCLCNAFWVLVIRAEFSNRFAYLSWFIYPIVIAYPLINLPIWNDQDRKTGLILLAYSGFTLFMELFVW